MTSPRNGPVKPKVNHATLAEQVYDYLREQILSNAFPPGATLPEEALAGELRVSRVPVREALRRLAAEGLVNLTPRHGAIVSSLSPEQFLDAYRVREALEALALRLATPRLTPDDLAELRGLHAAMEQAADGDDVDAFFAANAAFHRLFVQRAGNGYLETLHAGLIAQMRRYRSPSLNLRGGMDRSVQEHGAIMQAVTAGDGDEAARLVGEHIRVPQRILEEMTEDGATSLPLRTCAPRHAGATLR
ncbi:MAG: GntR family transcriptional regulator [Thermomicrobiales bacterium]|nr:GntR family transcriptional regulator [Thermomicrobiales bacterium]